MRLWVLGSGSRGNAVVLDDGTGEARVLVDAGFGVRTLAARLAAARIPPESIVACVVTHEHVDHVRGAVQATARWGWGLHASEGTVRAHPPLGAAGAIAFRAGDTVRVGGLALQTVRTPHDAVESVAVVATATASGARAGVCYDLGHATDAVRQTMGDLDLLVLEANHDEGMLRAGPYPPSVCSRIAGSHGHLSNGAAAGLARDVASGTLRHVVLAHLSESCNDAPVATAAVSAALRAPRFRGAVAAAGQDVVAGPFVAASGRRAAPTAQQLTLAL